jgi:HK97 family phage major capsid protein
MTTIDQTLIPVEVQQQVIQGVVENSVVLSLATVQPMPTGAEAVPVLGSIPTAGWTSVGGRKPTNSMSWTSQVLKAEEIAATIDVPTAYIDDAGFPLWESIQPMMVNALARAIDQAILLGTNAPASFPVGGVRAFSTVAVLPAAPANDVVGAFNNMLETVERQGLDPGGFGADVIVRGSLRGARISTGAPLWVPSVSGDTPDTIYGYPVQWSVGGVFDTTVTTGMVAVCGDWDCLRIGIRRDVTVDQSSEAVLADATGKVLVSAFQDDKVIMRVHMRLGCVIGQPFTTRLNAAAKPFSHIPIGLAPGILDAREGDPEFFEMSQPADPNFDPDAPTPPVQGDATPKNNRRSGTNNTSTE